MAVQLLNMELNCHRSTMWSCEINWFFGMQQYFYNAATDYGHFSFLSLASMPRGSTSLEVVWYLFALSIKDDFQFIDWPLGRVPVILKSCLVYKTTSPRQSVSCTAGLFRGRWINMWISRYWQLEFQLQGTVWLFDVLLLLNPNFNTFSKKWAKP